MKPNKLFIAVAAIGLLGASSCSDEWDSHYEEVSHGNGKGNGTLWQTICSTGEISNFKDVLEACGFNATLDGSQVCTVFAPTNASFSADQRDALIALYRDQVSKGVKASRNVVLKEFVKNHIALYNHSISSVTNDTIRMMNGKYSVLTSSEFAGINISSKNNLTNNGLLFIIDNVADYKSNVYEYIGRDGDLSDFADYVYEYSLDEFDPSKSVPGEIIDGKTYYLDSVTTLTNELLEETIGGLINEEDSTYWLLAPTNAVWTSMLEEFENYYKYDKAVKGRDSLMYNYPRHAIVKGTIFSMTENPEKTRRDSLMSTNAYPYAFRKQVWGSYDYKFYQYEKPFEAGGIFSEIAEEIECSNGKVMKADVWNVDKRNTFMRDIVMEGESGRTRDSVYEYSGTRYPSIENVKTDNPFYGDVSEHSFITVAPSSSLNIKALFDVRNVLSGLPYDVYMVTVPATAYDTLASNTKIKIRCAMQCNDEDGKAVYIKPDGMQFTPTAVVENTKSVATAVMFATTSSSSSYFTTVPDRVDSLLIGTFTFPTCSYGLNEPQVKLYIESRVSTSEEKSGEYSKTLRLDCIVAEPCAGEGCKHHSKVSN